MKPAYPLPMGATVLQVRDMPESVMAELRARAASNGISLSAYVRSILSREVSVPPMEEVMARIATRDPIQVPIGDIMNAIDEGRR